MHPIMSDLDITVRQTERDMQLHAIRHEILVRDIARENSLLGPLGRLADAIREFADPRGYSLRQLHAADLRRGTTGSIQLRPTPTSAQIHTFPAVISKDRERVWHNAA